MNTSVEYAIECAKQDGFDRGIKAALRAITEYEKICDSQFYGDGVYAAQKIYDMVHDLLSAKAMGN